MSSAQIVHLAQYAQSRMIEELNEGQAGVDAELQVCHSRMKLRLQSTDALSESSSPRLPSSAVPGRAGGEKGGDAGRHA